MKLRLPRPSNKIGLSVWSNGVWEIGNVTNEEFLEMFSRLPKPTQKRLYAMISQQLKTMAR